MDHDAKLDLADVLQEVRRVEIQSRRLVTGVMAGGYRSVFRGAGIEFDEVREYEEGDDPRTVDWNVTARIGRPFVKKYVDERELTILFLLDLSASMAAGFGAWSMRQVAARLCGCLALSAVKNQDKVGLIAFGKDVEKFVPPKKGARHALSVVRDCLALPVQGSSSDLRPAIEMAARVGQRHSTVFLLSDFLADGWERALGLCARRHDVIAVRLHPPELDALPPSMIRIRDPESGETVIVDGRRAQVREAYRARTMAWKERTSEHLGRARVDRIDVPVPQDRDMNAIAAPLLRFFRMRELRGAKR